MGNKHTLWGINTQKNSETFDPERETGKVYKVIVTVIKEDQSTEDVTVLLNEKGEIVKE